ncbi:polyprotein [Phytophthora megakarya]|uniref:Polyprotein n=1 Tax=Phytophthora megakarya TaxID=4795 RepID=A0A225VP55_9STRA|nr:polyprotein [Phytophthora megakarya]
MRLKIKRKMEQEELLEVVAYSDADYAADKENRKSVTGGQMTMDGMLISWMCRKQGGASLCTMEAAYPAAPVTAAELLGVRELLGELSTAGAARGQPAAVKQLDVEIVSSQSKNIDVRMKFVGDYTKQGILTTESCAGERMPADLMPKALGAPRLMTLRAEIGLY